MALTVIWNLIGSVLMLALAVLATEEASTNFQAVVFVVALIGYHRLSWLIEEDQQASRIRYLRAETWFHRIESAVRGTPPASFTAASMVARVGNETELEELKAAVETSAKHRAAGLWIFTATELLLIAAAVSVLVR